MNGHINLRPLAWCDANLVVFDAGLYESRNHTLLTAGGHFSFAIKKRVIQKTQHLCSPQSLQPQARWLKISGSDFQKKAAGWTNFGYFWLERGSGAKKKLVTQGGGINSPTGGGGGIGMHNIQHLKNTVSEHLGQSQKKNVLFPVRKMLFDKLFRLRGPARYAKKNNKYNVPDFRSCKLKMSLHPPLL